jgi:hypothetical protein
MAVILRLKGLAVGAGAGVWCSIAIGIDYMCLK